MKAFVFKNAWRVVAVLAMIALLAFTVEGWGVIVATAVAAAGYAWLEERFRKSDRPGDSGARGRSGGARSTGSR